MNFFNRAIKNVTRGMTKTILLVLTFFVIGNFVIVGLGVSSATENAKILTRQKMRAVVTYSIDYNKVWQYVDSLEDEDEINKFYEDYPRVRYSDIVSLLNDERIATVNALSTNMVYKSDDGLDYVHLGNQYEEQGGGGGQSCYYDESTGQEVCTNYIEPSFTIKANFFDNMIEIFEGTYQIVEGRFYNQEDIDKMNDVVVITDTLAKENGIKVGDTITVDIFSKSDLQYYQGAINEEDIKLELEVIGIYNNPVVIAPDSSQFDWCSPYENPQNMMLMPATSYFSHNLELQQTIFDHQASMAGVDDEYYSNPDNRPTQDDIYEMGLDNTTILLKDPLDVDQFVEDHISEVGQFVSLSADNEQFKTLSKPLDTLNLYANFIVWLVVINAIIIITLVTALTLKTREYEIGVLLSIGASKVKIVSQFFVELALVALIGFTLSVGSGSLIAKKIGMTMLEYQITSSGVNEGDDENQWNDDYISIWDSNYTTEIELEDLVAEYNVTVSPLIIGEIYVMGLGIVFISIIIPSAMIMRFNPKKILTNQG